MEDYYCIDIENQKMCGRTTKENVKKHFDEIKSLVREGK